MGKSDRVDKGSLDAMQGKVRELSGERYKGDRFQVISGWMHSECLSGQQTVELRTLSAQVQTGNDARVCHQLICLFYLNTK